jgi:SAM-dependent methyltransferase
MFRRLSILVALASAGLLVTSPACRSAPASPPAPDSPAPAEDAPAPAEAAQAAEPAAEPDRSPPADSAGPAVHAHEHTQAGDPGHGPGHAQEHAQEHAQDQAQIDEHQHPHAHHRFDDAEHYAQSFDNPKRDRWQKPAEVVKILALAPGHTVVDLGAGTGYFLRHLAPAVQPGGRAVGLDVEPNMVAYMEKRIARERITGAEARVVAAADPGLAASSVDRVLVVNTWHHLEGRVEYARKLHQALRPGGFVLVVDYTLETRRGPPPAARLAPDLVISELARAGFDAEVVTESLPDQYVVRGRKR